MNREVKSCNPLKYRARLELTLLEGLSLKESMQSKGKEDVLDEELS